MSAREQVDYEEKKVGVERVSNVTEVFVPHGHKQTEVGIIPTDWGVHSIGHFGPFVTSGSRGWAAYYAKDGELFVRISNLDRGSIYLDLDDCRYVSLPAFSAEGTRTQLRNGDLLISITADIGIIGFVDDTVPKPAYINQHIALVRFSISDISSHFVAYFLAGEGVQKLFRGSTDQGAKAGLNLRVVNSLKIAVPTVVEQTAIANALSDVDALISSLENLIAKKQAIKIATMQQLLTGRTRLPQFATHPDGRPKGMKQSELGWIPEDWEVKRLLDLVELIHGKAHEPFVSEAGSYTVVNSKFVSTEGQVLKTCSVNLCPAKTGDVLMVLSDLPNGRALAKCYFVHQDNKYAVNQRVCIFRSKSSNPKFLHYILNRNSYFLALDDGVTQTHILNGDIERCAVIVPENTVEQAAVSSSIWDSEREIQSLEQRLFKTRQIKQGMMQELLTGRTRLFKPAEATQR